jgi:hypothetical protein
MTSLTGIPYLSAFVQIVILFNNKTADDCWMSIWMPITCHFLISETNKLYIADYKTVFWYQIYWFSSEMCLK